MYNDKSLVSIFHLLIIENCEDIVQSYINSIIKHGLYHQCDNFYIRIKYLDIGSLNSVLKLLKEYDKFNILSIEYNNSDFSHSFKKYCNYDILQKYRDRRNNILDYIENKKQIPIYYRLGEVETILDMICNYQYKDILNEYDYGLFFHSKSISHITNINEKFGKDSLTTENIIKEKFDIAIKKYKKTLCYLENDRFGYIGDYNRLFSYKCQWFNDISIEKYLKCMKYYEGYDFSQFERKINPFPFIRGSKFIYINDYSIEFADRHAFADFPSNINFLIDKEGWKNISK